jgi:transposase-like protein
VLPSWRAFTAEDPLGERAYEQMVLGVATRGYGRSLEAVPEGLEGRGESKSAVNRRLVAATRAQLEEFLSKPLEGVDLKVLMLDGLHFAEHAVLVALGIDSGGRKHLLGLADGATENAAACLALLASLGERGLRAERSLLVLVDGNKALPKAIREVFGGRALVQRCQVHKKGNVLDHLPKGMRGQISASLSQAYHGRDPERARRLLMGLARKLEAAYPGAAASLREGLDETLTVMGMGLPASLERTLSSTNVIENLLGTVREVSRRVKRWRGGGMILRWMAAGLMEAGKGFRRVRGYPGMAHLGAALERNDERIDGRLKVEEGV